MNNLWAPWRLEYIKRDRRGDACFLCGALAAERDRENLILMRGEHCAVILNRYPYNNGHLMVFPFRHVSDPAELTPDEDRETAELVKICLQRLKNCLQPEGFNIGLNLGKVAGAGLEEHLHTHIVPRWTGDSNFMPVIADTGVVPQALDVLWEELHAAGDATG